MKTKYGTTRCIFKRTRWLIASLAKVASINNGIVPIPKSIIKRAPLKTPPELIAPATAM